MSGQSLPASPVARYYNIQMLRFVAATLVVTYHACFFTRPFYAISEELVKTLGQLASYGVLIFFGISGFVLTHAVQGKSAREFIATRFLRIFPGFWLATALIVGLKLAYFGGYPWSTSFLLSLTLMPVGQIPYPLGVEWSLVYEVFFYIVIVFAAAWLLHSNRVMYCASIAWALAILLAAYVWPGWGTHMFITPLTAGLSAFNLSFIAGILAYYAHRNVKGVAASLLVPLIPAFALMSYFFAQTEWRLLFSAMSIFLLMLLFGRRAMSNDMNSKSIFVRYGDYSYGLYLMHVPVLTIAISAFGVRDVAMPVAVIGLGALAIGAGLSFGALELALYRKLKRTISTGSRARAGQEQAT